MHQIQAETGDAAYVKLLRALSAHGEAVAPRGQETLELLDVTVRVTRPELLPPLGIRGNFNHDIAATETVHLLGAMSSLEQLNLASHGRFNAYADGGRLRGAYGPRLGRQLDRVEEQLRLDPDTRQAVAVIWNREEEPTRDVPCTVALTFRVRHGRLGLKVHMRSNDAHLGVPYDWFVFSRLQLAMAEVLNRPPGPYVHHVDSLHLYDRNVDAARRVIETNSRLGDEDDTEFTGLFNAEGRLWSAARPFSRTSRLHEQPERRWTTWDEVRTAARKAAFHVSDPDHVEPGNPLAWYYNHLHSLPMGAVLCVGCGYVVDGDDLVEVSDTTTTTTTTTGAVTMWRKLCGECRA